MIYFDRIFITGDTHGDYNFLPSFCERQKTTIKDLLIILGDTGINFCQPIRYKDILTKEKIKKACPITLFCIRGNHDIRPEDYKPDIFRDDPGLGYELTDIRGLGDPVWIDTAYPNIWFARDGGSYFFNGYSFLTIGGAYSVDKEYRKAMHWTHYDNEILSQEEQDKIYKEAVPAKNIHYDYVLTHTAPLKYEPVHLFMKGIDQSKVDKSMETFLEKLRQDIRFDNWFFGHYHADEQYEKSPNVRMFYQSVMQICLNNGDQIIIPDRRINTMNVYS